MQRQIIEMMMDDGCVFVLLFLIFFCVVCCFAFCWRFERNRPSSVHHQYTYRI